MSGRVYRVSWVPLREDSVSNFGLVIAYLLPGFVTLWGVSTMSPLVQSWLAVAPETAPTVGGFLYVTLASIAGGLTVSVIRWLLIDTLHHATGIPNPRWNFAHLQENLAAYDKLVEIHYRYYQFYANTLVAITFGYAMFRFRYATLDFPRLDMGYLLLSCIFWAGSRDTLRKYYTRVGKILGTERRTAPEHRSV